MTRVYRNQKEYERFLIREFVRELGYQIARANWKQERPDALLTLSKGSEKKRVGIEHTDYFNDTIPGTQSPLSPIAEFWKLVESSLVRRISHRKRLGGISARVRLNGVLPLLKNRADIAKDLAAELVHLVEANPIEKFVRVRWSTQNFQQHQTLRSCVASILASRWTNDEANVSRCSWMCSNITTGFIGLNLGHIKAAIETKNQKAKGYTNWGGANEKWLLIAASGRNLSNHAGPSDQNVIWADSKLLELCRTSPFDRIVFWERSRSWYKWLKPDRDAVQY